MAVERYVSQLRTVAANANNDPRLRAAAQHLIETHHVALRRREQLTASDVTFSSSDLSGLEESQLLALLDQHVLGLGRDDAPLICMGTEEAYDAAQPEDLALACAMSVLWLCGSRPDVLNRIDERIFSKDRVPPPREYHLHPNDFYRLDLGRGRGTWKTVARLVQPNDPHSLLLPSHGADHRLSLGDVCYQIEVSAYPSKFAAGGKKPNATRADFLCELVAGFDTASALIFHGGAADQVRSRIASSFLDRQVRWTINPTPREWFAWDGENGRAVMHTYALNGPVRYRYLDLVRAKLREVAPSALSA
jgi:hypothetical protein